MGTEASFDPEFLSELKASLLEEGRADLAEQTHDLQVHEVIEGGFPVSQFIYVVPKSSVSSDDLSELCPVVYGLYCLLLAHGRIAVVQMDSRDALLRTEV